MSVLRRKRLWLAVAALGVAAVAVSYTAPVRNWVDGSGASEDAEGSVWSRIFGGGNKGDPAAVADASDDEDSTPEAKGPGVIDVQHYDWLQQDLERLVEQTRSRAKKRIGPDEFRTQFLATTAEYLELDDAAKARFDQAVDKTLSDLDDARDDMKVAQASMEYDEKDPESARDYQATSQEFSERQKQALGHMLAALDDRPRHQMLREDAHKWVLRLDYGLRAAVR